MIYYQTQEFSSEVWSMNFLRNKNTKIPLTLEISFHQATSIQNIKPQNNCVYLAWKIGRDYGESETMEVRNNGISDFSYAIAVNCYLERNPKGNFDEKMLTLKLKELREVIE